MDCTLYSGLNEFFIIRILLPLKKRDSVKQRERGRGDIIGQDDSTNFRKLKTFGEMEIDLPEQRK